MADFQTGNPFGVQQVNGNNRSGALTNANLATIETMKTRLAAVDAGFYTAARLRSMTYNDLVYAVRMADNNGIR